MIQMWRFKFTEISYGIVKCSGIRNSGNNVEVICEEQDRFSVFIDAYDIEKQFTSLNYYIVSGAKLRWNSSNGDTGNIILE